MHLNVVLVEPEIPWNTGNVGRTCVAAGATLHLVGRLGFELSERRVRRAGLDYWPKLDLKRHRSFADFEAALPAKARLMLFSTSGRRSFRIAPYGGSTYLVFGRESAGLPPQLLARRPSNVYRIPMRPQARSLNLSTAAAVAVYEALRACETNL